MKGIMNRQTASPAGWKGLFPSSLLNGQLHHLPVAWKLCKQRRAHGGGGRQLQDLFAARILREKVQTELVRIFSRSMGDVIQKGLDRERRVAVTYRAPLIGGNAGSRRMKVD